MDKHCQFGTIVYTLFVLSTLLVFEHIHAFLLSMLVLCCTMVTTKQWCCGACRSNSRYADPDRTKNVFFIRFSKPHMDRAKAERWANACRREDVASVKKDTYMCSVHFIGDIVFTRNHVYYNLSSSWLIIHGKMYICIWIYPIHSKSFRPSLSARGFPIVTLKCAGQSACTEQIIDVIGEQPYCETTPKEQLISTSSQFTTTHNVS